jgi:L-alanine-DL-glutamate epimerase-like enolase superfamily enzyme
MPFTCRYYKSKLPFRYPFTISGGRTKTEQPALIVCLSDGETEGYGEAPAITYYGISVDDMVRDLHEIFPKLKDCTNLHPSEFYAQIYAFLPTNSFLRCALDMAFWDYFGKIKSKPLFELFGTVWIDSLPVTDYTLGLDTPAMMCAKMRENTWPVYKIKVGQENDLELLGALRTESDVPFRVDANGGWDLQTALLRVKQLEAFSIELIEQPLKPGDEFLMPELYHAAIIPLYADESCVSENDVEKCAGRFHGINIKLTKCGGITPALRMIKEARALDLKVMMGSMNESSIGSAAIAQFLPQLDFVDMDGPLLLSEDLANGLRINSGKIEKPSLSGLGIEFNQDIRFAVIEN